MGWKNDHFTMESGFNALCRLSNLRVGIVEELISQVHGILMEVGLGSEEWNLGRNWCRGIA
ncbi:hypothetical protein Lalb_Chr18g0055971 [Lupinus albus]|uniref:Uncharacterized protein n=1 Tax=Lupinus albus TaxID=3870 RepID=A0A6A4NZ68_LUPAL|nr:hypothetical protein Lalb_Chr18g0055971 [Lupinus albus]